MIAGTWARDEVIAIGPLAAPIQPERVPGKVSLLWGHVRSFPHPSQMMGFAGSRRSATQPQ